MGDPQRMHDCDVTHPVVTVTQTSNSNCAAGADVQLYTIAGEGHEWPGGPHLRR